MANSIIVLYDDRKSRNWIVKLYKQMDGSTIQKIFFGNSKILLKDGGFIFFIKPRRLKRFVKAHPNAMIMREDQFIRLYL